MDSFFSKSLELNGANSTTSYVLWSMVIFLAILVVGIALTFLKRIRNIQRNTKNQPLATRKQRPKGFQKEY